MSEIATPSADLPTARASTDEFKALCDVLNYHWYITWKWAGRDRAGVLKVYDRDDNLKARIVYGRGNQLWGNSDRGLNRVRTGSRKHAAVLEALQQLQTA